MSEYELLDLILGAGDSMVSTGLALLTVLFAYVVAAFAAGARLSRTAAISISVLYSLWYMGPLLAFISSLDFLLRTAEEYRSMFPEGYAVVSDPPNRLLRLTTSAGPYILGWLGSLVYMHLYVRKGVGSVVGSDT